MTSRVIDLSGQKFGALTVLNEYEVRTVGKNNAKRTYWKCFCENCGRTKFIQSASLKNGGNKSCGCKYKNLYLINQRFGKLLILNKDKTNSHGETYFNCLCDCGKTVSLIKRNILTAKQCKYCSFKKGRKSYKDISLTYWNVLARGASIRGTEFEITIEYAWEIWEKQQGKCAISGVQLNLIASQAKCNKILRTASVDRIDSSKGYIKGNIQWVHKEVNDLKSNWNEKDFINWIKIIYEYQFQKEK